MTKFQKYKMTDAEVQHMVARLNSETEVGGSLRGSGPDIGFGIWVNAGQGKWVYEDMGGTLVILSAEELVREYGPVSVRNTGIPNVKIKGKPAAKRKLTLAEKREEEESIASGTDVGGTVIGRKQSIWVKTGAWNWVNVSETGRVTILKQFSFVDEHAPLVLRTDGKIMDVQKVREWINFP